MISPCRLCKQQRELCRSHVIPEWAYRPIYDRDSRALALSSDGKQRRKVQQGLRERLFCLDCERFFNELDHPFHRFWSSPSRFSALGNQPFLKIVDVDYETTRDFLLSVLWRAHVASSEVVSAVNLGPHAERIRTILCTGWGGCVSNNDYPIYCYLLRSPETGGIATQLVLTPVRTRTKGQWNYEMAFLGCAWKIFVSSQRPPLPESCKLKPDGTIVMPVVNTKDFPAIRDLLDAHGA